MSALCPFVLLDEKRLFVPDQVAVEKIGYLLAGVRHC
jgi:hypothetical protein